MKNIFLSLLALSLLSCEKVIDVDLNDADPQAVIDAQLKEGADSLIIRITETTNYFDNTPPKNIEGATISLNTSSGKTFNATASSPGVYVMTGINAASEETYTLNVNTYHGNTQATSFMPSKVDIDSLYFEYSEGGGFSEPGYRPFIAFQDPPDEDNYYRLKISINSYYDGGINVFNDRLNNGEYNEISLFGFETTTNDTVRVELWSINKDAYNYYSTLAQITGDQGGPPGIAPGNPVSNLTGAAKLGFFCTYSSSTVMGVNL